MQRLVTSVLLLAFALSACGGEPSLTAYTDDLESAVEDMNAQLDALDVDVSGSTDLDQVKQYARDRVAARTEFMAILEDLEPPDQARDLHQSAISIMGRLTNAESDLADYVLGLETATDLEAVWSTPLGVAARTADAEAVTLCHSAQAELNQTEERADLEGVPWIPPELKEVVTVAFGCLEEDR